MKIFLKLLLILQCMQLAVRQKLQQQPQQSSKNLKPFVSSWRYNLDKFKLTQNLNESDEEFQINNLKNSAFLQRFDFKNYYKLRFRPVGPMPRFLWPKIKLKFNQTATTAKPDISTTTTTAEELTTITTTEIVVVEDTTIAPMVITTTPTNRPALTPRPWPTPMQFTTPTTIMRPFNKFKPFWFDSFKKVLLFGSPFQANLLQQHQQQQQHSSNGSKTAKGKGFLGLFEVIKFNNTACSVDMDDVRTMDGVCYHEFECKNLGGIPTKPCADGAGICCIFVTSCGDSSDQSVIYFESPNYPNPVREMMICVLIVNLRPNVEQLRLDFIMFELNRPSSGDCLDDQFIVSGQNMNYAVPILCGINTGQHIYLHVGNSFENKIYLSFFAKVPKGGRSFNVKIAQLEDNLAPPNCLQYFTEAEGIVKSFNYDIDGSIVDNKEATYLNNLNYAICIQRAKETCSVAYITEQGNGEVPDFQIINKDEDENDLVPDGQAGAGIFNCPDDFIAINSVRLCGERFNDGIDNEDFTMNAVVRDIAAGPIMLPVRTDNEYVGRGFRLLYKQELCV